jgi:aspartyl-tRNA(Asn)/glutamyl-tRNA(Gln) amidotransferase subunit B
MNKTEGHEKYDLIIGLEIHVEPKTNSKMFCACSADFWEKEPNTQTCPVCLGLPGALPLVNKKAVELMIKTGLALHSTIRQKTKFDRKHYFYPDLPKGYQLSQYDEPICEGGFISVTAIDGTQKQVDIRRIHMEEDVAKALHAKDVTGEYTLIDYNKSGVPLFELVTEPVLSSSDEAWEFAKKYQQILRYLGVSDADIEKGQMRCEPNISIQRKGTWKYENGEIVPTTNQPLLERVEVKNIGSIRFMKNAIEYEFNRLVELAEKGEEIRQQTRGWNPAKGVTEFQRYKENAQDYRYFPDPDVPPLEISDEMIETIRKEIPELPEQKIARYSTEYGISAYDAAILTEDKEKAEYVEQVFTAAKGSKEVITDAVKFINGIGASWSNASAKSIVESTLSPEKLVTVIELLHNGDITRNGATQLIEKLLEESTDVSTLVESMGLRTMNDNDALSKFVDEAIAENPNAVADYKAGKMNAIGFLMGQVMRKTGGSAKPADVQSLLKDKLSQL